MFTLKNAEVYRIDPEEKKSEKFRRRRLVVSIVDGDWKQYVVLWAHNNMCDTLDNFQKYDLISSIEFKINGRPWDAPDGEEKIFSSLVIKSINP